jgi:hypothetical protein
MIDALMMIDVRWILGPTFAALGWWAYTQSRKG